MPRAPKTVHKRHTLSFLTHISKFYWSLLSSTKALALQWLWLLRCVYIIYSLCSAEVRCKMPNTWISPAAAAHPITARLDIGMNEGRAWEVIWSFKIKLIFFTPFQHWYYSKLAMIPWRHTNIHTSYLRKQLSISTCVTFLLWVCPSVCHFFDPPAYLCSSVRLSHF